jgi:hypothetical protein
MYAVMAPGSTTNVWMAWPVLRNFLTETWTWGYSGNQAFDIYNWWIDDTKAPLKS